MALYRHLRVHQIFGGVSPVTWFSACRNVWCRTISNPFDLCLRALTSGRPSSPPPSSGLQSLSENKQVIWSRWAQVLRVMPCRSKLFASGFQLTTSPRLWGLRGLPFSKAYQQVFGLECRREMLVHIPGSCESTFSSKSNERCRRWNRTRYVGFQKSWC